MLFLLSFHTYSQNPKLDSLKVLLLKAPEDTTKSNLLIEITRAYLYDSNNRDDMQNYAIQNLTLSKRIKYSKGIAYSFNFLGIIYWGNGDLDEAVKYCDSALILMREINDLKGESSCLVNLGSIHNDKGNYTLSLQNTLKALKIKQRLNSKKGIAICYNNLGSAYMNNSEFKQAVLSFFKSLKLHEELKDSSGISACYTNIGKVFEEQNKFNEALLYHKKALSILSATYNKLGLAPVFKSIGDIYLYKKEYEKALENYQMSLDIAIKSNDKMQQAECYNGIGNVYLTQKKYQKALEFQFRSLNLMELAGSKKRIAITYNNLGGIYEELKNYNQAIAYYKKALDIATEIDAHDALRNSYQYLTSAHQKLNDYKNAFEYLKLYYTEKDSLLNKENFMQISEINTRYQTEKKEQEIQLLTKDQQLKDKTLREQSVIRIALIIGLGLLVILLFTLYNRFRFKQKANRLLEKQKKEILEQNILINDSIDYAKTIQETVFPGETRMNFFFPDSFALYKPKAIVSGDFYLVLEKNNKTICAVADCTGHGIPGAFMSLLGFSMMENIIEKIEHITPSVILTELNKKMVSTMSQNLGDGTSVKHGMDVTLIMLDHVAMELQFAGAHNSLYHIRDHTLTEYKADRMSVGSYRENTIVEFTNHVISLKKGDMLYLFSDGFPDQIGGPNRKKFFYPPFKELLLAIHQLAVEKQKAILNQNIAEWKGERDQTDDILVVGIRI